jgi:hypothetical protein
MTEALTTVADWALKQPGIWRIGDLCDVENLASARVMEKAGFFREGMLVRWSMHPNVSATPRDCFSFAKVKIAPTGDQFLMRNRGHICSHPFVRTRSKYTSCFLPLKRGVGRSVRVKRSSRPKGATIS